MTCSASLKALPSTFCRAKKLLVPTSYTDNEEKTAEDLATRGASCQSFVEAQGYLGAIRSSRRFLPRSRRLRSDVRLTFKNATKYNEEHTAVHEMGKTLKKMFFVVVSCLLCRRLSLFPSSQTGFVGREHVLWAPTRLAYCNALCRCAMSLGHIWLLRAYQI